MKKIFKTLTSFILCFFFSFAMAAGCGPQGAGSDGREYADDDLTSYYQLKSVAKGAQDDYYVKINYFPNYGRHTNAYNTDGFNPFYETEVKE